MSPKIALAALLLASVPFAGLADDSSSNSSDIAVEKKSDNRSQKPKRDSSDIRRPKEERRAKLQERRRPYEDHVVHNRGEGGGKGGRNPSPDD